MWQDDYGRRPLAEFEKTCELIKQENEQKGKLLKELITTDTSKDTSSQTNSQLETSTMIVNKLDICHCDSMKLVRETL